MDTSSVSSNDSKTLAQSIGEEKKIDLTPRHGVKDRKSGEISLILKNKYASLPFVESDVSMKLLSNGDILDDDLLSNRSFNVDTLNNRITDSSCSKQAMSEEISDEMTIRESYCDILNGDTSINDIDFSESEFIDFTILNESQRSTPVKTMRFLKESCINAEAENSTGYNKHLISDYLSRTDGDLGEVDTTIPYGDYDERGDMEKVSSSSTFDLIPDQNCVLNTFELGCQRFKKIESTDFGLKMKRTKYDRSVNMRSVSQLKRKSFLKASEVFSGKSDNSHCIGKKQLCSLSRRNDLKKSNIVHSCCMGALKHSDNYLIKSNRNSGSYSTKFVETKQKMAIKDAKITSECGESTKKYRKRKIPSSIFQRRSLVNYKKAFKKSFEPEDLIIGNLIGFGWWFGKVVMHNKVSKQPPRVHHCWVYWYGDHRVTEVQTDFLEDISMFACRYNHHKRSARYVKAVKEVLLEAAKRSSKPDLPVGRSRKTSKERLSCLINWAIGGFQNRPSNMSKDTSASVSKDLPNVLVEGSDDNLKRVVIVADDDHKSDEYNVSSQSEITLPITDIIEVSKASDAESIEVDTNTLLNSSKMNKDISENEQTNLEEIYSSEQCNQMCNGSELDHNFITSLECKSIFKGCDNDFGSKKKEDGKSFSNLVEVYEDGSPGETRFEEDKEGVRSSVLCGGEEGEDDLRPMQGVTSGAFKNEKIEKCKEEISKQTVRQIDFSNVDHLESGGITNLEKALTLEVGQKGDMKHKKSDHGIRGVGKRWLLSRKRSENKELSKLQASESPLEDSLKQVSFKIGDLIIGKLKKFDWWFGKIVQHTEAKRRPPLNGCFWVFWFGDHKISEMSEVFLETLATFPKRFNAKKMKKKIYKQAVKEILEELARRSLKTDLYNGVIANERHILKALIDWAMLGFQPRGIDEFYDYTGGNSPDFQSHSREKGGIHKLGSVVHNISLMKSNPSELHMKGNHVFKNVEESNKIKEFGSDFKSITNFVIADKVENSVGVHDSDSHTIETGKDKLEIGNKINSLVLQTEKSFVSIGASEIFSDQNGNSIKGKDSLKELPVASSESVESAGVSVSLGQSGDVNEKVFTKKKNRKSSESEIEFNYELLIPISQKRQSFKNATKNLTKRCERKKDSEINTLKSSAAGSNRAHLTALKMEVPTSRSNKNVSVQNLSEIKSSSELDIANETMEIFLTDSGFQDNESSVSPSQFVESNDVFDSMNKSGKQLVKKGVEVDSGLLTPQPSSSISFMNASEIFSKRYAKGESVQAILESTPITMLKNEPLRPALSNTPLSQEKSEIMKSSKVLDTGHVTSKSLSDSWSQDTGISDSFCQSVANKDPTLSLMKGRRKIESCVTELNFDSLIPHSRKRKSFLSANERFSKLSNKNKNDPATNNSKSPEKKLKIKTLREQTGEAVVLLDGDSDCMKLPERVEPAVAVMVTLPSASKVHGVDNSMLSNQVKDIVSSTIKDVKKKKRNEIALNFDLLVPQSCKRKSFLDATENISKKKNLKKKDDKKNISSDKILIKSKLALSHRESVSEEVTPKPLTQPQQIVNKMNHDDRSLPLPLPAVRNGEKGILAENVGEPAVLPEVGSNCMKLTEAETAAGVMVTLSSDSKVDGYDVTTSATQAEKMLSQTKKDRERKNRNEIEFNVNLLVPQSCKRKSFLNATENLSKKKNQNNKDDKTNLLSDKIQPLEKSKLTLSRKESDAKVLTPKPVSQVKIVVNKMSCNDLAISLPTIKTGKERNFGIGDLVLGKLKRFNWWFGKIVNYKVARQRQPLPGNCWVLWFGDRKLSEMSLSSLESLSMFPQRFLHHKVKGVYKKAVSEVLNEAAKKCCKTDIPDEESTESAEKRLAILIDWALNGFSPMGVDAIYDATEDDSLPDDDKDSSSISDNLSEEMKDIPPGGKHVSPSLSSDIQELFNSVAKGKRSIENLCLGCGDTKVEAQHPLFEGGLCKECKDIFKECTYMYDEDGYQMYCTICSDGDEIILCDEPGCCRSYCPVCLDMFCGIGYSANIAKMSGSWKCFMCTGERVRILKRRDNWQEKLKEIFQSSLEYEHFPPMVFYDSIPYSQRKPIRVLALFDGIGTGYYVLKKLDIQIEMYIASEIDEDATKVTQARHGKNIKHVGDVRHIYKKQLDEWGPFDLLIGGSPCNDLSIANPLRKGIYEGTGRLFFEFYRIRQLLLPHPVESRPFFWLFENVVGMRHGDREVITRFLQCPPVLINSKSVSAQQRSRYFWGNLPGMNRQLHAMSGDKVTLQDCLEPNCGRIAKLEKVRCITTMTNSLKQTKRAILPIQLENPHVSGGEDGLWLTEIERIFGFPQHYTDIGNMGQKQRQKLLGKSWCVPVMRHLFSPLRDYFKTNTVLSDDVRRSIETQTYSIDE